MSKNEKKKRKNFSIESLENYIDNLSNKLDKKIDHKKLEEDKNKIYWKGTRHYTETFKEHVSTYALIIGAILLILAVIICSFAIFGTKKENEENELNKGEYSVKIHIDFTENLIFSRYDVILSIGEQKKRLNHGENADIEFYVDNGSYSIIFENAENSSIKTEKNLTVNNNDIEIGYKISCYSDKIAVTDLYFDENVELQENEIKMTTDKSSFVYKNYKDVINELEQIGFTNIIEKPLYDIELGFTPEGEVKNVTIDGNDNYSRGDVFQKDVEVIVSYHLKSQDDPEKISVPYSWVTAKNINYDVVEKAFKDSGFTHVVTHSKTSAQKSNENKVYDIKINGSTAYTDEKYKPDDEVVIYYYTYEPRVSETKLEKYYARKAFEEYGEKTYRYGFKCHWVVGLLDEKENSDGSFSFKVEVTITNQYGAEYDAVAEGTVSGTNANPKVTNFRVN